MDSKRLFRVSITHAPTAGEKLSWRPTSQPSSYILTRGSRIRSSSSECPHQPWPCRASFLESEEGRTATSSANMLPFSTSFCSPVPDGILGGHTTIRRRSRTTFGPCSRQSASEGSTTGASPASISPMTERMWRLVRVRLLLFTLGRAKTLLVLPWVQ